MTGREHINEYFNGRPFMILCALAFMTVTTIAVSMGIQPSSVTSKGLLFTFQERIIGPGALSTVINLLCLLATGAITLALNKVFGFVRSVTHLFVSAFFLLQLAYPANLVSFNVSTLLCLATGIATMPLFASFQDRHSQRSIFLIFFLVAAGSMFHYAFLALIPAFLLGFLNMGVLNLKGMLAMLFGLITPFWIVLGLGIASPADFTIPTIHGIWNHISQPRANLLLWLAAFTAVTGIVLGVMNLMTIMNYRRQTRVYNAFFVFVLISMVIALCVDYDNATVYLPLLNLMVAIQIAHAYTLRMTSHRYLFILLLAAVAFASLAANIFMP